MELKVRHKEAGNGTLEVERDTIQARIDKLRDELNSCTTSKQYSAVQDEMKLLKEKVEELETEILETMEVLETDQQELAELEGRQTERITLRTQAEKDLQQRTEDVSVRLAELEKERQGAAAVLPEKALRTFDRVADMNEGETLTAIREVNRRHREYVCGACNMELPFNAVVLLTNNSEEIVQCVGCERILYIEESLKSELAK
jgi:predicted  nucleic acid-binding Zn-ribbon protein